MIRPQRENTTKTISCCVSLAGRLMLICSRVAIAAHLILVALAVIVSTFAFASARAIAMIEAIRLRPFA